MKIGIHHKGQVLYENIPARSTIKDLIHSLKINHPILFNEQKIKLYKDKKMRKKLKKENKLSNLILNMYESLEYSTAERCNILYCKTTYFNSLCNRIKLLFCKRK